ncbi:MAG: hypothetical protein KGY76_03045 [Candidatus Thermoplasmatota archaeon]|nr:hypothetical protein [Candidatus Thermoplasmatota archaeon]
MTEEAEISQRCPHESADEDWLPLLRNLSKMTLAPHPYCDKCGLVRNVGPDRPRKLGYYVDKLSEIEKYLKNEDSKGGKNKLTEAQKRLIVKEMEDEEIFNDLYGVMESTQEKRFIEIVQKYRSDIEERVIKYHLE